MLATEAQVKALVGLFRGGTRLTYEKGEFIIRPGESPPGIFYIETGQVKAYNITKYGEENLLIIRKSKEIFPLIWAVTGQERQVIYQALAPSTLWRSSREDFIKFMSKNSETLSPILDMTIEMYRIHSERIINLEYRTVRERLISFLLTMGNRFGKKVDGEVVIGVPLKQQDIASSINSSRETTSRELAILDRKGLISTKQPMIVIRDIKALRSFL